VTEPADHPAPPLRPWRPMAAWTAGMVLLLGLICFVVVVAVPQAIAKARVRTLLNSPTPNGGVTLRARDEPFFGALAKLAEAQGHRPEDYIEFRNAGTFAMLDAGRAVTIRSGHRDYVMAILECTISSIPGISAQQLVLMDSNGRLLDKLSCNINSRYGRVVTEILEVPDAEGVRVLLVFKPGSFNGSHWHNWHTICHGAAAVTFREEQTKTASAWDQKGLCRISIEGDRFVILWPEMTGAESR
jgi:hypothetical protein